MERLGETTLTQRKRKIPLWLKVHKERDPLCNVVGAFDGRFASIIQHKVRVSEVQDMASTVELDSHADSPVVVENAFILERTGRKVSVTDFTDVLGISFLVDVVHAAVAYDYDISGKSYHIL